MPVPQSDIHFEPIAVLEEAWHEARASGAIDWRLGVHARQGEPQPLLYAEMLATGYATECARRDRTSVLAIPVVDPGPVASERTVTEKVNAPSFQDDLDLRHPLAFATKRIELAIGEQIIAAKLVDQIYDATTSITRPDLGRTVRYSIEDPGAFGCDEWRVIDGHTDYDSEDDAALVAKAMCREDPFMRLRITGRVVTAGPLDPGVGATEALALIRGTVIRRVVTVECVIRTFGPPAVPGAVGGWMFGGVRL